MLIPRKVKYRKQHHPGRSGQATGGTTVSFGEFGIQALTPAYVTNRQIESARIAMTRHIKRGGKVWINIYPDRPLTKKPAETRMGSGKGSPEWWVANVKPGRVLFEVAGVSEELAREALTRAIHKLPLKARIIKRGGKVWINIYPDRPLTKKPAETRMGSGKGSPEWWVANVKPGRIMFELAGVDEDVAREAMRRAIHKLPMKCKFVTRESGEF